MAFVRDPDTGPAAAELFAHQLPRFWSALQDGRGMPEGHGLVTVRTVTDHWFFGAVLASRDRASVDVDPAAVRAVQERCLAILGELVHFPGNVDGILDVIPPDRVRERVEQWGAYVDALLEALELVQDLGR